MNTRLWFVVAGLIFLVIGIGALMMFISPGKPAHDALSGRTVDADDLYQHFIKDESLAVDAFVGQSLTVKGVISDVNSDQIILNDHIVCLMYGSDAVKVVGIGQGKEVVVTGKCVSWDKLFEQLNLENCILAQDK